MTSTQERNRQECTRGEALAVLAASPGKPRPEFRQTDVYEAVETVAIDARTDLSLRQFGCTHYALEFTFLDRDASAKRPAEWMERSAHLLANLNVAESHDRVIAGLADFLAKHADDSYTYGEPLQMSDIETLSVSVEQTPAYTRLVVLYNAAI